METEKGQITRIYNGEIITPERNFGVGTVLIAEGKIIGIEPGNYEVPGSIGHDAHGGYIAPGFIDLHTHGAGDSDFMDCTEEDCLTIAREHLRHGTTLLYPTTLASDNQEGIVYIDNAKNDKDDCDNDDQRGSYNDAYGLNISNMAKAYLTLPSASDTG